MRRPTLLCAGGLALVAAVGVAYATHKEGKCKLQEAGAFDGKKHVTVEVGDKLKATCSFYTRDFFKKKIISAGVKIKNPTKKAMCFHYYVAFFDKGNKLIGCTSQGSFSDKGLAPGKETQLGSCLIPLPPKKFKEIASYQVVFYEAEKPVGQK